MFQPKLQFLMQAAIRRLTIRYAPLRSTIDLLDGIPHVKEFHPISTLPDVRLVWSLDVDADARQVKSFLRQPFQFSQELAVKWCLVQQRSGLQLYLVAHHIVLDGKSMSLLSRELLQLYEGNAGEFTASVPDFSQVEQTEVRQRDLPRSRIFLTCHGKTQRAWLMSSSYKDSAAVCLSQIHGSGPTKWSLDKPESRIEQVQDFRQLQIWGNFSHEVKLSHKGFRLFLTAVVSGSVEMVSYVFYFVVPCRSHSYWIACAYTQRAPPRQKPNLGCCIWWTSERIRKYTWSFCQSTSYQNSCVGQLAWRSLSQVFCGACYCCLQKHQQSQKGRKTINV